LTSGVTLADSVSNSVEPPVFKDLSVSVQVALLGPGWVTVTGLLSLGGTISSPVKPGPDISTTTGAIASGGQDMPVTFHDTVS
jgi:hypothetical protein